MGARAGAFVISLDFELHWGVCDRLEVDDYRENLLGVRRAIPRLLDLFDEFAVHATWATVGMLFYGRRTELLAAVPAHLPGYVIERLSPYPRLAEIGADEASDPFHFGRELVDLIRNAPHQELATHTFSHFYCLEPGQTPADFRHDLAAAVQAARTVDRELTSIVFPRNQVSRAHLDVCAEFGIRVYRGCERSWLYHPRPGAGETVVRRLLRGLDSYVALTGDHLTTPTAVVEDGFINIPSSRFLRPFDVRLRHLERLKRRRITRALTHAARTGTIYHLWWHPHNFGRDLDENLATLRAILEHFRQLAAGHGMRSLTMSELAREMRADSVGEAR